jgi:hypothetical protein
MNWSDLPWNPPARTLRQFAALWLLACAGLCARAWLRHGPAAPAGAWAVAALLVGPLGLWRPPAVRPVWVLALAASFPLGWAVSRLTLAGLFFLVLTPLGLLLRLAGRDSLRLRPAPGPDGYWLPKPATEDVASYLRQF